MSDMESEFLLELAAELGAIQDLGQVPVGNRRIIEVSGGSFVGPVRRVFQVL
ncbi:MAG: hypothetical protein VCF08_20685 [Alphaproteobacteria bacterium]